MGKRLGAITDHTKNVDEFQQALAHINAAALQRMPDLNTEALTPSRRRATSGPKSAFPPMKLKPSKALELPPALQDALRHTGISFNQNSVEALRESLAQTQIEREKKLDGHYSAASSSMHDRLAERLGKADRDTRAVLDALFSHTPFTQINLTNPKLEEELKKMERKLQNADRELLNAESSELSLSNPKVRAFISKYGK